MPTYEEMRRQGFYPLDNSNAPAPIATAPITPTVPTPPAVPTNAIASTNAAVPNFADSIRTGANPAYNQLQPSQETAPVAQATNPDTGVSTTPSVTYTDMAKQGFYPESVAPKSKGFVKKTLDAAGLTDVAKDFYQSYMNTTADTWNQVGGVAKLIGLHSVAKYSKNLAKGYRKDAINTKTGNSFADTIYKTMGSLVSPQTALISTGAALPAAIGGALQAIGQGKKPIDVAKEALMNVIFADRKSVVQGKSVDLGGRRIIKKKT